MDMLDVMGAIIALAALARLIFVWGGGPAVRNGDAFTRARFQRRRSVERPSLSALRTSPNETHARRPPRL